MPKPVDLRNLREMIDGDIDLEKELFAEFISSSEKCITTMKENCTDGESETWRSTAHALKGMSMNLGAGHLGELCRKAQDQQASSAEEKQQMLGDIQSAYDGVKAYLETL